MAFLKLRQIGWAVLTLLLVILSFNAYSRTFPNPATIKAQNSTELTRYRQAAQYSEAHEGLALVVLKSGQLVFESYAPRANPNRGNNLASGTKSFSCAIAVLAMQDGLLALDEPVAKTITEWQRDPQKAKITIRQLLTLTSGITGGQVGRVPTYTQAISAPLTTTPGTQFQYGPVPFQIFGEVIRRKFQAQGIPETPLSYLEQRIFKPLGLRYTYWQTGSDGQPHLPSGAWISAREWAKYGTLMMNRGQWQGQPLLDPTLLHHCFQGTPVNPAYGLTFWLNKDGIMPSGRRIRSVRAASDQMVMAIGAGNQVMFILPDQQLVIVRQGRLNRRTLWQTESGGFDREQFLRFFELTSAPKSRLDQKSTRSEIE